MKKNYLLPRLAIGLWIGWNLLHPCRLPAAGQAILGWNNLGMHCMDSDYSVFSILPPYNTIHAQLIIGGKLVTNMAGYTVTYQAVADPDGSINTTSAGKGNFYSFAEPLYGVALEADEGLLGFSMPGPANTRQPFTFDEPWNWFRAEGISITPYDDAGHKNYYPMMRIVAWNAANQPLATNDIVLPVSDEMDCRACHASGTHLAAQPAAGWVWSANPERDYRLNILRKHDDRQLQNLPKVYPGLLASQGYNSLGLYRTVVADGVPILCAKCHVSEALPGSGVPGLISLTAAVHGFHAEVFDLDLHLTLDDANHRAACYRCHPGSTTRCLRGAMGGAIAKDGSMALQCQSCHGNMTAVGNPARTGWLDQPNCQSCHTGTALENNGQLRYTSVFETNGTVRVATNQTFATNPDTPAAGFSLFRFSSGHGGLQCEACHGSTHAEFPSTHRNDNLRNLALQGHVGVTVECTACHSSNPNTVTGGPHGMHPLGQNWVNAHNDRLEDPGVSRQQCRECHGTDYRGTVLSRMQSNRMLATDGKYGTKNYWRGRQVSCYDCHNGPNSSNPSSNTPATVASVTTNTVSGEPVAMVFPTQDPNGNALTLRVVSQPTHGSVGVSNLVVTYFPDAGFVGTDSFTVAVFDGYSDSNLATGTVQVDQGPFSIAAKVLAPTTSPLEWPVVFRAVPVISNVMANVEYLWDFGDGSPTSTEPAPEHTYLTTGRRTWTLIATVRANGQESSVTVRKAITVVAPELLQIARGDDQLLISWPVFQGDALLEWADGLPSSEPWPVEPSGPVYDYERVTVPVEPVASQRVYRLRKL